jgi:pyruvate formate lyase activating enzyme
MQGIVFDIKRFTVHDGPGIRTTVFFKGCPLQCFWCHNPESIDKKPFQSIRKIKMDDIEFNQLEQVGKSISVGNVMDEINKDRIFMEESNGGVTFSGGEPTMQPEFLYQLLVNCKSEGLHTAVDTCGYASKQIIHHIIPYTDIFLFDLKHYKSDKHKEYTGKPNEIILENQELIIHNKKKIRIRIPVIPGFNNTINDLQLMAELLQSLHGEIEQVDLLPYHTIARNKYLRFGINNLMKEIKGLHKEDLIPAKKIFEEKGFNVKIGG